MSKNEKIAVFVAASLALVFFVFFGVFQSGSPSPLDFAIDGSNPNITGDQNQDTDSDSNEAELVIQDLVVGDGSLADNGSLVAVHYVGTFLDGTQFDSSLNRGEPLVFTLGQGLVIEGWDKGVLGMRVGGVRRLTIPPELGYGSLEVGPIPPNSTLIFEVELLDVE